MKTMAIITMVIVFGIVLMFDLSNASDYAFGTKVSSIDNDLDRPLKNMPDRTAIGFWDIGPNVGIYDAGDVVYLEIPPIGIVNANDIRLTPFGGNPAGSKVMPNDRDMNAPLKPLKAEIRFSNLIGSQSYSLEDPVYVHQSNTLDMGVMTARSNNVNETSICPATACPTAVYPAYTTNIATVNPDTATDATMANPPETKGYAATENKDDPSIEEGFWQRLPYTGYCGNLPQGITCLTYTDNFIWPVFDYPQDNNPSVVGIDDSWRPIEAIRCNSGDYYHIIGTLLTKSVPRQKIPFKQSASCQKSNTASNSENIGNIDGSYADNECMPKVKNAINRIGANLDSICTNDIRLTSIGELKSGTKVLNFDPDLKKLVALPILASFPKTSDDYACIRVYDANGNGLYDSSDDVYLDVSFPGYSSFGTVSVNDIRLSGPFRSSRIWNLSV